MEVALSQVSVPRVAVIGGGISGLAAAFRLQSLLPQVEVHAFEASPRWGGTLDTRSFDDFFWENGADSFSIKIPWGVELCERLGIVHELMPTSRVHRRALVACRGKLEPVPSGFVLMRPQRIAGILATRVLSLSGKLRLMAEPFIRAHPEARSAGHDESVASFARRRLGCEAFERLVQPLLAGIYVADAEKLSLAATMPEFLAAEREYGSLWRAPLERGPLPGNGSAVEARRDPSVRSSSPGRTAQGARYHAFVAPRDGLAQIVAALVAKMNPSRAYLQSAVSRIIQGASGKWEIKLGADPSGAGSRNLSFDGIVIAIAAPQAAGLLRSADEGLAKQLATIEYASSVVVNLGYHPSQFRRLPDGFGFVVPQIERMSIVAASFPSVKFERRGNAEWFPVRVFLGGAQRPDVIGWDDDQILSAAKRDLERLVPIEGTPRQSSVVRWIDSMPQYHVGHVQLVERVRQSTERLQGLELAGNAYDGVGIPQCIHSGNLAAERIANYLAQRGAKGAGPTQMV